MSALGDVVQALAVVPAIREGFPGCRIHWLVEETAEPVVRCHPSVDRVLVSKRLGWSQDLRKPRLWPRAVSEVRTLIAALRGPYDVALDLQGLMKSGIWMGLVRARRKVGFAPARERLSQIFLTERLGGIDRELHAVDRYLELVASLGCPRVRQPDFGIRPPADALDRVRELLASNGCPPFAPLAVVVPGARWETKRWTEDGLARLGDQMAGSLGLEVVFVGVEGDRPLVSRICHRMGNRALNLAGRTDIPGLMALLEMAWVVVSTDSGPMHMAAALGTPVVALFGPTAPWRTGPYGAKHKIVRVNLPCSPCFRRRCSTRQCMHGIEPGEVLSKVEQVLEERESRVHGMRSAWAATAEVHP